MSALHVKIREGIAAVTLSNGKGNLFDYGVYNELGQAFAWLGHDDAAAVVVLQADGRDFTLGHDMAQLESLRAEDLDEHYRIVGEGLAAIYDCPKPTVAAAQGMVVGAGLAAVAACDVIVAADDAHFMVPEIRAGIIGCTEFLELLLPKGLVRY